MLSTRVSSVACCSRRLGCCTGARAALGTSARPFSFSFLWAVSGLVQCQCRFRVQALFPDDIKSQSFKPIVFATSSTTSFRSFASSSCWLIFSSSTAILVLRSSSWRSTSEPFADLTDFTSTLSWMRSKWCSRTECSVWLTRAFLRSQRMQMKSVTYSIRGRPSRARTRSHYNTRK
ncbi:hypothetical protein BJ912DRAFT_352577 [Pholiota molesta]|nr:hypothetical protein BJ912DRAFT_352577 [Pholiota molesta]